MTSTPQSLPQAGSPGPLPHDIKDLLPIPLPWWVWIVALLVVLAVSFLALRAWRHWRNRRRAAARSAAVVDPFDQLAERLTALQGSLGQGSFPVSKQGRAEEHFYFDLSLIAREAIELQSGITATDMTLGELQSKLSGAQRSPLPLNGGQVAELLALLERADRIKFAGAATSLDEARQDVARVQGWLSVLKPVPMSGGETPSGRGKKAAKEGSRALG